MQKPSKRLETVLRLAKIKQQRAAEQLGAMIRNADAQQQQAEQLRHYELEYGEQFKALAARGSGASQLLNYQKFFSNLSDAKETQQQQVRLANDQKDQARSKWQHLYARENNLAGLVDKKRSQEEREIENRIQRELDDRRPAKPPF